MNYTPREHSGDRKRLSLHNHVSILPQETGQWGNSRDHRGRFNGYLPKVQHHAHVTGEYTTGNREVRFFEAE